MRLGQTVITSQTLWSLGLGGVFWFPLLQWNSEKVYHTVGKTWAHTYVCVDYRLHALDGVLGGTVIIPALLVVTKHSYFSSGLENIQALKPRFGFCFFVFFKSSW